MTKGIEKLGNFYHINGQWPNFGDFLESQGCFVPPCSQEGCSINAHPDSEQNFCAAHELAEWIGLARVSGYDELDLELAEDWINYYMAVVAYEYCLHSKAKFDIPAMWRDLLKKREVVL